MKGQAAEIELGRYYSPRAGFMAGRRQRLSRAGIIPLGLVLWQAGGID
jgi:hypothetical protein